MDTETGALSILKGGTTTITATFAGNDNFKPGSASYTLNVTDNRIATSISCDPIELDVADVATLTKLAPVVMNAEGGIIEYTNEGFPPTVSFDIVSDPNGIIGSLDNNSGEISMNAVEGTATIKAYYNYYNVNSTYKPSECTFTITVAAPFTGGDVTFAASTDKGNTTAGAGSITKKVVTFACSNGVLGNGSEYRLYKNSQTTFSTSAGKITKIVFTQPDTSNPISNLTPDVGSLNGLTWTGRASSVVFTASAQARASQIVVTVDLKADPDLSFDESASFNAVVGEEFTAPTLANPHELFVYYESDNEDVATVDAATGAVTIVGPGEATITAKTDGDDSYSEGSASYTIKVTAANQIATPVITLGAENFFESTTATITCETAGVTILYSTDRGETWKTYTDVLTLTETTTLVAKATKEGATDSQVSEAVTASKYSVLEGLAGMAANATTKSQTSYVKLSNAQVTARAQSGNGGEMQDATTGVLLYNSSFVASKLYNGIFSVTYVLFQGNPEITAIEAVEGEGTITDASSEVEPALVTLQELVENFSTYLHKKIIIVGATVTTALENKDASIKQNGVEMALRENNSTSVITKLTKDAEVNVVGYPAIYSSKQQIYIYSDDDISAIVDQRADSKLALGALNSTTLNVGDKIQLNYTSDSNGDITWSTSNGNVLTVDQQGNVEAVAVGEATITVAQSETESYKAGEASIKLTVVDPNQGQYLWLLSEASYSSASTDAVTWTSDYATMVIEKDNAGTNANNYLGGDKYTSSRFYANSILTITRVEGYRIASVLFQATSEGYATTFKNSTWTNAAEVVISGEKVVTITPTDGMEAIVATIGGTCGFDKVLVTYVKTDEVVNAPSITITPDTYNMDAKAGGGELPVVCKNLATDPQLEVVFVEADGVTPAAYDWITAVINDNGNINGQIQSNTGEARTAYFYVRGVDADNNVVKSNLVTFTQEAPATEPSINVNTGVADFEANGGEKTFGFEYENLGSDPTFAVQFFESDGTTEAECGWILSQFVANDNKVTITAAANDETSARTAYFKIYSEVNKTKVYSNLVTINQAAGVVDPNQGQYLWLLSEASYSSASTNEVTWASDYATMVIEKAGSGTNTNNYLGGDANKRTSTRFYTDQVLTITRVEGYRIASVLFQATSEGYATTFKNSTWTNAAEVVISGEKVVTITPTDGMEAIVATIGGTCGFDKVLVTYVKTDEVVKPVPSLAFVDAANMPITKIGLVKDDTFTATLSTDLSSTEEILISIQPDGIVSYDNNIITALDAGEATITATFAGNDSYKPASAQLKVVVSNPAEPVDICEINGINPTSLTISETAQFTLDATFVEGLTIGVDYEILWESSDPTILDVHSNGLAVANGVGTAEVTVKVKEIVKNEADKRFIDMEKTFTVTVYGPATQVQGALIAKLADGTYRAVTNDATTKKNWLVGREVTVINGKVLASEDDSDISWTITTRGDVATFQDLEGKFISAPASGNNIGLADAASESTQWTVDGDSWTKLQGENQKTILWNNTNQGFRYYAASNIDNSGYSSAITYSEIVPGCTRTLSNTWGTVCFSRQVLVENTVNARFYWVAGKVLNEAGEPIKLILREEDWALKTGYPFIVEAIDPTAPVIMLFEEGELVEHALNMNGLYGTHTETEVPEGDYILSGGQFVKCGTGCSVAADRAYLKMEEVPVYEGDEAGVKVFNLDGEDGISSLDAASEGAVIYDLSGRRVSKTAKGLYIINGKKVSVK